MQDARLTLSLSLILALFASCGPGCSSNPQEQSPSTDDATTDQEPEATAEADEVSDVQAPEHPSVDSEFTIPPPESVVDIEEQDARTVAWDEPIQVAPPTTLPALPAPDRSAPPKLLGPIDATPIVKNEDEVEVPNEPLPPFNDLPGPPVVAGSYVEPSATVTPQADSAPDEPDMRSNPLRPNSGVPVSEPPTTLPATVPATQPSAPATAEATDPKDEVFDPILVNGPVFVDWPTPKLALLISGRLDGYIEPCGCAGLDKMKGGLSRRHTLFQELEAKGWPVVGLDTGGMSKRGFGPQALYKLQMTIEAMKTMGYDAIGFGKSDLKFPAMELLAATVDMPETPSPFLSANTALLGFDSGFTKTARVIEAGGLRVGVTSILGSEWQKEINNTEVEMADPAEKLALVVPTLSDCDVKVLLSHATMEETIELGKAFDAFDIVVTAGGMPSPPMMPERIDNTDTLLIEVGEKGMDVIVLGFYDDPAQPIRYQRVPLDSRYAASPAIVALMDNYQWMLKRDGLDGLGIRAVTHPLDETNGGFVGSKECGTCHEDAYDIWRKSGHAHAWSTLVELKPARNYDPECISCHVVGWHPTEYFPYESGFTTEAETPQLVNVGCENCHGPGQKHVDAENGADYDLQTKLQQAMVITKEESEERQCVSCHDLDNSPEFDFDVYWSRVEHYEE